MLIISPKGIKAARTTDSSASSGSPPEVRTRINQKKGRKEQIRALCFQYQHKDSF